MSAFVVVDLESTSREPAEAHIVEWAAVLLTPEWFGEGGADEFSSLVRPPVPIPPETSAVHHITDADVATAPSWEQESQVLAHLLAPAGVIAVAHNAEYERTLLNKSAMPNVQWLCTYKAALRVWPDAPGHSNECLRYFLGHGTGRRGSQVPHSALHDARVTAQILGELLKVAKIEDMLKWTNEPALLPTCPLGEWRGKKWEDVDQGFLLWIMRKIYDREDVRFCANMELERRAEEMRKARAAAAPASASAEDDIPF